MRRAALCGALCLVSSGAAAQRRREVIIAEVSAQPCSGDPDAWEWLRALDVELGADSVVLVLARGDVVRSDPDLRLSVRGMRCGASTSTYELSVSRGDREGFQAVMVPLHDLSAEERPRTAALRIQSLLHTHRAALWPRRRAPVVEAPLPPVAPWSVALTSDARLVAARCRVFAGAELRGARSFGGGPRVVFGIGASQCVQPRVYAPRASQTLRVTVGGDLALTRGAAAALRIGLHAEVEGARIEAPDESELWVPALSTALELELSVRITASWSVVSRLSGGIYLLGAEVIDRTVAARCRGSACLPSFDDTTFGGVFAGLSLGLGFGGVP